jgi:hypothetical protein
LPVAKTKRQGSADLKISLSWQGNLPVVVRIAESVVIDGGGAPTAALQKLPSVSTIGLAA